MRATDRLAAYISEALHNGVSRPEIAARLNAAGWSDEEVARALALWHESEEMPPVPRPSPSASASEAFSYGLTFIAFAICVGQAASLGFALIDLWLTDPDDQAALGHWRIRSAIASLIVFLPIFVWLSWRQAQADAADRGQRRSAVRDWLGHIAMLFAALVLLGNLVSVVTALLNGDVSMRFVMKSGLIAVLAGLTIAYFRRLTRQTLKDA